jgi:hypothetical protein
MVIMRIVLNGMAAVLMLTAGSTALACDCITLSPSESFQEADVVFEGELIQIKPIAGNVLETTAYTFRVRRLLKGAPAIPIDYLKPNLRSAGSRRQTDKARA